MRHPPRKYGTFGEPEGRSVTLGCGVQNGPICTLG
jgi:hypothetical protein